MKTVRMDPDVARFAVLVDVLADLIGPDCEVVLHDVTKKYENSIVKIRNGHITGRNVGGPITDLGLQIIRDNNPDTIIYDQKSINSKFHRRSAGIVIRNDNGKIVGFLCINWMQKNHDFVDSDDDLSEEQEAGSVVERFDLDSENFIRSIVSEVVDAKSDDKKKLKKEQRLEIVKILENKGVFLVKGSVKKVAEEFNMTSASIYKYLEKIRSSND